MCNPRRVNIRLDRSVEEAWRTSVEETARAQGEVSVSGQLRLDIPLDAEMGDRALITLERLMAGELPSQDGPWERDASGRYRRELGEVTMIYEPGSRELLVETRLAETLSAAARASAEAGGFTVGEVSADAVGRYYDDGWGGRTEENARAEAEAEAERRLAEATEALHRSTHAAELEEASATARAEAERRAASELERLQGEMRSALRHRLQAHLASARARVSRVLHELVGEAYRHTLIQLVRDNGGRLIQDERRGSVIELEMELY